MLDPQRIPEKLLRRLAEREVDFRMAIGTLDGFALISQEIGRETYAIHPLVQASVHYWLEQSSEKADYAGQALQLLAEFPNGEHEHRETCESMLAHAQVGDHPRRSALGASRRYLYTKPLRTAPSRSTLLPSARLPFLIQKQATGQTGLDVVFPLFLKE